MKKLAIILALLTTSVNAEYINDNNDDIFQDLSNGTPSKRCAVGEVVKVLVSDDHHPWLKALRDALDCAEKSKDINKLK